MVKLLRFVSRFGDVLRRKIRLITTANINFKNQISNCWEDSSCFTKNNTTRKARYFYLLPRGKKFNLKTLFLKNSR